MNSHDPRNPDRDPADEWPRNDALDRALSPVLAAPALPAGFRAALRREIEFHEELDALDRKRELEAERARRLAQLREGYVRVSRNTLVTALAVAFTAGAAATVALPWLASRIGTDPATLAPALTLLILAGFGAAAYARRFRRSRAG